MPEVNLGIMPGMGGTQILPRIVGEKVAKRMFPRARNPMQTVKRIFLEALFMIRLENPADKTRTIPTKTGPSSGSIEDFDSSKTLT